MGNPSVSTGAPVSLDWSYKHESSCSLDEYEFEMNTFSSSSLVLNDRSPSERFHLLRQLGYSRDEIAMASFTAKRIRDEREQTVRQVERKETIRYIVEKLPFAKFCRNCRRQRKQKREEQNQVATSSSSYFFENSFHTSYSMSSSPSSSSLSSISEKELSNESSLTQRRGYSLHHSVAVAPATSADDNNYYSEEFPKAA